MKRAAPTTIKIDSSKFKRLSAKQSKALERKIGYVIEQRQDGSRALWIPGKRLELTKAMARGLAKQLTERLQ